MWRAGGEEGARGEALLEVEDLRVEHRDRNGRRRTILAGVELTVRAGETVGIVGESGSGKSMLAKAVARLLPRDVYASGTVRFSGEELLSLPARQMDAVRGRGMTILYQDPFTMLNPLLTLWGPHIRRPSGGNHRRARRGPLRIGSTTTPRRGRDRRPRRGRPLPLRALRRHAPASGIGVRPGPRPLAADRRRAIDGPGRDHPSGNTCAPTARCKSHAGWAWCL